MSEKKSQKMTLKGYYYSLPRTQSPRKYLLRAIMDECGVPEQTARNWCIYGMRPRNYAHVKVISRLTKIKEEDLWAD